METNVLFVFNEHEDLFLCVKSRVHAMKRPREMREEKKTKERKSPDNRPRPLKFRHHLVYMVRATIDSMP